MTESLEARLARLEDIEAIRQLKARYCQACDDDHNPDAVAACFIEDGLWEGADLGVHARGHQAIRDYIGGVRASGRVNSPAHMVMNPIISVDGDAATAHWRFVMMYANRSDPSATHFHRIVGFYQDEYVRTDAGWLMSALRVTVQENNEYKVEK
jgi:uncharacterized protein (TIGR02246 family)